MSPEAERLRKIIERDTHFRHPTTARVICRAVVAALGITDEMVGLITEREITVPGKGERRWVGSDVAANALSALLEVSRG